MSLPTRLGRYAVRRRIGSGGFATVWLCFDEHLDSPVAVKVLADNWAGDHHVRQRFIEEGRFLRKVDSPHVVPVYDFGELEDERPFLVMAFADQGNLAERIEQGGVPAAQTVRIVREVGAGLTSLHHRGVLHRDVKPANVLFRSVEGADDAPQVRAMLGDLGLGKAIDMSSRLTMVGGTPAYVAPEQARGERMDARADQYSLGALAYQLLAGRPAYNHGSLSVAGNPPELDPLGPEYPDAVDRAVRRAMAPRAEDRWADVSTFTRALSSAMADVVGPDLSETSQIAPIDGEVTVAGAAPSRLTPSRERTEQLGPAPQEPRARRRWPWVLAGAAAAALGLGGGWYVGQQAPADVRVADDNGQLAVTVPAAWAKVEATEAWTPPGLERTYSAMSVGAADGWQEGSGADPGVFLGIYPGDELPEELPGHEECDETGEPVGDATGDHGPTLTVTSTGCPGDTTTVERIVQVADERLLWIQVKSPDRASANAVLDSVEVSGL